MPFYSYDDVLRVSKLIQEIPCEVSEELRGWNWNTPPLLPVHNIQLNVSDLSFSCETGRLAFLRYRMGHREQVNEKLNFGSFIHRAISLTTSTAKSILYNSVPRSGAEFYEMMLAKMENVAVVLGLNNDNYVKAFKALWKRAALTYSSSLDRLLELSKYLSIDGLVSRVVPWICEFPIDGRLLGLGRAVRIDALVPPSLIIEFKTRKPNRSSEIALAAYALIFESLYKIPVNHAVIIYVDFDFDVSSFKTYERIVKIDDPLRLEFVEKRDLYASKATLDLDPGLPGTCDVYCPYLSVCRDGS